MTQSIGDPAGTGLDPDRRRRLADDLVNELTTWTPRERMGTFQAWHRHSLSLVHLSVLAALEARGPLSMSQAAEALDVSIASATGIVDRMEKRHLVVRRHAADDRRVVLVDLADAGRQVFRDLEAQRRLHLGRLLEELSEDELAGFLGGLRALRAARVRLHETAANRDPGMDTGPTPAAARASEGEVGNP